MRARAQTATFERCLTYQCNLFSLITESELIAILAEEGDTRPRSTRLNCCDFWPGIEKMSCATILQT